MDEDIWFEEDLVPTEQTIEQLTKDLKGPEITRAESEVDDLRPRVRVHTPRWQRLADTSRLLTSGVPVAFYQVRLGFEVEVSKTAREAGVRFEYAQCLARLWAAATSHIQPSVYDLYPAYLDEGKAREISVEFGPEIKIGDVGGSLGRISTDVRVGQVEPVVVGWKGEGEREPHWELRPQSKTLLGVRHLWLLIQVPEECQGARLAVWVEGDVKMHRGILPVGPKLRVWDERKMVLIR
jgi:hypothetical protein